MISYFKIPAHVEERSVSVYVCMCACVRLHSLALSILAHSGI